jgi:hypothetical protein
MSKPKFSKLAADPDFGPRLAAQLNAELALMALPGRVLRIASLGRAVFTTSLGLEDQVLTSVIAATRADLRIVTLDTGRLFAETETLIGDTEARYDLSIEVIRPWKDEVDGFVALYGMNGFYDSVEARHACCHARKLQPLGRALADAEVWVTGLRRGQSGNRANSHRWPNGTPTGACLRSIRWPTSRSKRCRPAPRPTTCHSIRCMRAAFPRSDASPAPAPSSRANPSAPGAGGGSRTSGANADFIFPPRFPARARKASRR